MKKVSLLLLRISIGLLMVWWGLDKLVNVEHAVGVSDSFYLGLFSAPAVLMPFGVFQTLLGALIVVGLARAWLYPVLLAITGVNVLAVWNSILDPWGWVLEGTSAMLYPSLIILAGSLVLFAWRDQDVLALEARREERRSARASMAGPGL